MSDFLQRLVERTLGSAATVQPRIASRFTSGLATQELTQANGESPRETRQANSESRQETRDASGESLQVTRQAYGAPPRQTRQANGESLQETRDASGESLQVTRQAYGAPPRQTRQANGESLQETREPAADLPPATAPRPDQQRASLRPLRPHMSVETAAAGQSISPLRHRKDRLESDLGLMKTNPTELAEGCESAASAQVVLETRIDSSPQKPMVTLRDDPGPIRTEPAVQEGAGRPSTDTAQVLTEFSTYNPPGNTFSSAPFERETGSPEREPGRNNPGPPVVRVTIGRIDVRVVAPAATTEPRRGAARPPTIMSLDKYLKQGNGRQR